MHGFQIVDIFTRRNFVLKPRYHLPVAAATMATLLKDALTMVAASHNLGLFSEDGEDLDLLLSKLRELEVGVAYQVKQGVGEAMTVCFVV